MITSPFFHKRRENGSPDPVICDNFRSHHNGMYTKFQNFSLY